MAISKQPGSKPIKKEKPDGQPTDPALPIAIEQSLVPLPLPIELAEQPEPVILPASPGPIDLPGAIQPAQAVPLYQRNPGPAPRLPRRYDARGQARTSYRLREIIPHPSNYRWLLWLCAAIGVGLLFTLLILKPQNRVLEVSPITPGPLANLTPAVTIGPVPATEQFALVIIPEGLVLEEPRTGASQVQNLKQYTFIAFQRKSTADAGWYQLKGGSGWISAASVKTYPTEQAAWDAKNVFEKK